MTPAVAAAVSRIFPMVTVGVVVRASLVALTVVLMVVTALAMVVAVEVAARVFPAVLAVSAGAAHR